MKCERCGTEHQGVYGSGRFCSPRCARGFSTASKRGEINEKVSEKLSGSIAPKITSGLNRYWVRASRKFLSTLLTLDFDSLSREAKRIRVIIEQGCKCLFCGLNEWQGQQLTLELDHEDGNKENNRRTNLRGLCPNCHSTTPTWKGRKRTFKLGRLESLKHYSSWIELKNLS